MTDSAIQMEKTKKYDMPLSTLDYEYISKCDNVKELEKIIKVLRSGEEGHYPDLERTAMEKLETINPKSRLLRKENPVLKSVDLKKDEKVKIDEDMQDFVSSMKTKEEGAGDIGQLKNTSLPPIRKGQINMTTKQQESKPQQTTSKNKKPVAPRSYKEWDKVDIDQELEAVDKEEEKKENNQNGTCSVSKKVPDIPLELDPTGLSREEVCLRANREKDKGNEAFNCGDYEEAVLYYTRSLSLLEIPNTYNNRAIAYIRLCKWKEAIDDCDEVLDEEPENVKGLLRRSTGYIGIKDFNAAERDLKEVLVYDPDNKRVVGMLKECETGKQEQEKQKKERKVKGRRMVIEETDGTDEQDGGLVSKPGKHDVLIEEIPSHKQNGLHEDPKQKNNSTSDVKQKSSGPTKKEQKSSGPTKKEQKSSGTKSAKVETKKKEKDIWSLDEIENFVNVNSEVNLEAMSMGVSDTTTLPTKPANIKELTDDEDDDELEEIEVDKPTPITITEITDEDNQEAKKNKTSIKKDDDQSIQEGDEVSSESGTTPNTTPPKEKSPSPAKEEDSGTQEKLPTLPTAAESTLSNSTENSEKSEGACSNRTVFKQEKLPPNLVSVKEEGSTLFRTGQYGKAILRYTNLIDELEKDVVNQKVNLSLMYSNRAACYLKTGHCKAAMTDCQRSLDIIPHAIKPLLRRAAACEHLEKFSQAYIDYKHILSIDSSVALAQSGSSRCQQSLQQMDGATWREKLPPMETAAPWEVPEIILDSTSSSQSPAMRELTSPPPEDLPNPDLEFDECKKSGNSHVQKNEFEEAVECYSKCVKLCPDNAVGYTNRAHCYLKLNQPKNAVIDCDKAIKLDKVNCKALYRRALAKKMLKQFKDSLQDLSEVLKLDSKNTAALKEFDIIKKSYKEELVYIKETTPPAEQAKKKARRISIEEVEEESSQESVQSSKLESKSTQRTTKAKANDNSKTENPSRRSSEEPQDKGTSQKHGLDKKNKEDGPAAKTPGDKPARKPSHEEEMQKIQKDLDWMDPKQPEAPLSKSAKRRQKAKSKKSGGSESVSEEKEIEETQVSAKSSKKDKSSTESDAKGMKKNKNDTESDKDATKSSKSDSKVAKKPETASKSVSDVESKSTEQKSPTEGAAQSKSAKKKKQKQSSKEGSPITGLPQTTSSNPKNINATPYEFMTAWNSLKSCKESESYTQILRQIPPKKLPTVISNKLEGPMLNMILKCVKQDIVSKGDSVLGYQMLHHLSTVPRFSTVSMFLSAADKKELSGVFTELSNSSSTEYSAADLETLKKAYSIN